VNLRDASGQPVVQLAEIGIEAIAESPWRSRGPRYAAADWVPLELANGHYDRIIDDDVLCRQNNALAYRIECGIPPVRGESGYTEPGPDVLGCSLESGPERARPIMGFDYWTTDGRLHIAGISGMNGVHFYRLPATDNGGHKLKNPGRAPYWARSNFLGILLRRVLGRRLGAIPARNAAQLGN